MRKIDKSRDIPSTLMNAPVPTDADSVQESIYKANDVRCQLVIDQHYKCAYCECSLSLKYHDVEHYRPKSLYYWLGHEWENLMYSCERCNRSYKKSQFPLAQGSVRARSPQDDLNLEHPLIVNPTTDEPSVHIKFNKYMAVGVTPEGEKTIEVFHLNDSTECPELIDNRKQLYDLYKLELDKIKELEQLLLPNLTQQTIDKLNKAIELSNKSINNLGSPSRPFSGMLISQLQ